MGSAGKTRATPQGTPNGKGQGKGKGEKRATPQGNPKSDCQAGDSQDKVPEPRQLTVTGRLKVKPKALMECQAPAEKALGAVAAEVKTARAEAPAARNALADLPRLGQKLLTASAGLPEATAELGKREAEGAKAE